MRWTIRNKMFGILTVAGIIMLIMVAVSWVSLSKAVRLQEEAAGTGMRGAMLAANIKLNAVEVQQWLTDISASRAAAGFDDGFTEAEKHAGLFRQNVQALAALHPDNVKSLNALGTSFEAFYTEGKKMAEQYIQGGPAAGNRAMESFDTYATDIVERIGTLGKEMDREATTGLAAAMGQVKRSRAVVLGFVIAIMIVASVLIITVASGIAGAMAQVGRVADAMAEGRFDDDIAYHADNDVGDLAEAFRRMRGSLLAMLGQVKELVGAAVEGRLTERADTTQYQGDFGEIVGGINRVLDTVVGHLDMIPVSIVIMDTDNNIRYINKTGARIAGTDAAAAQGKKCHSLFRNAHCETSRCAISQAMKDDRVVDAATVISPGGNDMDLNYTGVPIHGADGSVVGAFEIAVDQTEVKNALKTAEQLGAESERAAKKAEKINAYQKVEVDKLINTLNKFAMGDLRVSLEAEPGDADTAETRDKFGLIATAFNRSVTALSGVVGKILLASESVVSASEELSATAQQISKGAETQASSLEQTSSSITEMSATIHETGRNVETQSSAITEMAASVEQMSHSISEVARNAGEVNGLAGEAAQSAKSGGESVDKTVNGMNRINETVGELSRAIEGLGKRSEEIGNIVSTINDIAEQTNLLALNAAIEAARAGEHGKGFAVVADEVRKLAERSQMSTRDIAELIKGIQNETNTAVKTTEESARSVREGIELANEAGMSIRDIIRSVDATNKLVAEISLATEQQAEGSEQIVTTVGQVTRATEQVSRATEQQSTSSEEIVKAVDSVNRVTQQNSAAAGEMANSTNQLAQLAADLRKMVDVFKIDRGSDSAVEAA